EVNDSLHSLEQSSIILKTEDTINDKSSQEAQSSQQSANRWAKGLLILFGTIFLGLWLGSIRRKRISKKQQQQILELEQCIDLAKAQIKELEQLQAQLEKHNINDEMLTDLLNSHLKMMIDVVEESYHTGNKTHLQNIRSIVQFQDENKKTWTRLFGFLDLKYKNIISLTRSKYPSLSEKDLLLIAMTTLDFSYIQMAMILGYNNASTISSIKIRLAKKMGLDGTINEYINQFKNS
ncbi:MAG: hypothetical protein IKS64_02335, partial [Muribaculaceae bacterium]|nr:hypothetical protein [Muribaculaceae bacterium]